MRRRGALALALLLTTIAAFVIVAYGTKAGLIGSDGRSDEAAAETTQTAPAPPPPADPKVIDEYIYQDEYVDAPASGSTASGSAPKATSGTDGSGAPEPKKAEQSSELKTEEGLKGPVLSVESDGFVLRSKHGDFRIIVPSSVEVKNLAGEPITLADIHPDMLLKIKVAVQPGTFIGNPDGSFTAVSVRETTVEDCHCSELL